MTTPNDWDSSTDWRAPGVGVTATFDYKRKKCGSGMHREYKRNDGEAKNAAENKRNQYLKMGFTCSPIVYRTGA